MISILLQNRPKLLCNQEIFFNGRTKMESKFGMYKWEDRLKDYAWGYGGL